MDKKKGESLFSVKIVFYQGTESFRRGSILCSRKFRVSKSFMPKREIKGLSIESLLSHSTEKLRVGTRRGFTFFPVSKNFMDERRRVEGRSVAFSCKERFVSQCRQTSYPSVLRFRKFLGSKNVRVMRKGITILRRNFFESQYRIISQWNPSVRYYFRVSKIFLLGSVMSQFFIGTFLSHGIENLRGGTVLCFTKILLSRKLMYRRGTSQSLTENLLCHTIEKLRKGTLLCFTKILLWRKLTDRRGTSHTLTEILLSHTIEKLRKGTLLCFTKFLLSKNF